MTRISIAPGAVDSNKGDQALVANAIKLAREIFPLAEICVISSSSHNEAGQSGELRHTQKMGVIPLAALLPSPRREHIQRKGAKDNVLSIALMSLYAITDLAWSLGLLLVCKSQFLVRMITGSTRWKTFDFLSSSDCVLIKGGGFIYAYRGFRFYYYLYFQLYLITVAIRLGVPVIILPNSFGPFETRLSKYFAAKILNKCTLIATREDASYHLLLDIGVSPNLLRNVPDMGFMTEVLNPQQSMQFLKNSGYDGSVPAVGFTARPWRFPNCSDGKVAWENYVNSMVCLVKHVISKGYKPIFFPQSIGPHDHEDDRIAIGQITERLAKDTYICVEGDFQPMELAGMYGLMRLFVGTRMHSVIFAMLSSVPCIAISYQGFKATGIMEKSGLKDYVVPIENICPDGLIAMFDDIELNHKEIQGIVKEAVLNFKTGLQSWKRDVYESLKAK